MKDRTWANLVARKARQMRLFLYGTLLDPDVLAKVAGRHIPIAPATLHGWRRVATPDGRYPTLRRARAVVDGALVAVNSATLARLAAYEGPSYRLTGVVVRTALGNVAASSWIAPGRTLRDWP